MKDNLNNPSKIAVHRTHVLPIILMALLILISLSLSAYSIYQIIQIKKRAKNLESQVTQLLSTQTADFTKKTQPVTSDELDNEQDQVSSVSQLAVVIDENLSNETDWQTYSSASYGFSFNYPPDYIVKQSEIEFSGKKYPIVKIMDPKTGLELLLDFKLEFGLTELGFHTNTYNQLASEPNMIRVLQNSYDWIYYQRSKLPRCMPEKGGFNSVPDGTDGILCYDVNFPNNWYYSLHKASHEQFSAEEIKLFEDIFKIFDQIVLSLKFAS
jgi:hypothetical protein